MAKKKTRIIEHTDESHTKVVAEEFYGFCTAALVCFTMFLILL